MPPPSGAPHTLAASTKSRTPPALLIATALAAVAAVLAATWVFSEEDISVAPAPARNVPRPASSATEAQRDVDADSPLRNLRRADVDRLLTNAKRRAAKWKPNAAITSLRLERVTDGHLDRATSSFHVSFGQPSTARVGAGAPVLPDQLYIDADQRGLSVREKRSEAARGLADPQCPLRTVIRTVGASGVPPHATLDIRYVQLPSREPPVWQVEVEAPTKLTRVLDAHTCTIIVQP